MGRWVYVCVAVAAVLTSMAAVVLGRSPEVSFLRDSGGADWVVYPEAPALIGYNRSLRFAVFRTEVELEVVPKQAPLAFRAHKVADVYVNDQPAYREERGPEFWKEAREVDVAGYLRPGTNSIQINVANEFGPAAIWARGEAIGVVTSGDWLASRDGKDWLPVRLADAVQAAPIDHGLPTAGAAFGRTLFVLAPLGFLAALILRFARDTAATRLAHRAVEPGVLRWVLMAALAGIGVNNFLRLPLNVGMDSVFHYELVRFIAERKRLPLVDETLQAFRSPLPYVLYAGLHGLFSFPFNAETADKWIRLLPIACGVAQVQVCYLALRAAFPGRALAQSAGLVVGGLLPANLYMSQVVGDEPFAALAGGASVALAVCILTGRIPLTRRASAGLGLLLGLALLSKYSAVLLIPPLAGVLILSPKSGKTMLKAQGVVVFLGIAAIVSGWFFVRNYVHYGQFLIGGWDAAVGVRWWQDPGYRTVEYLLRFGTALRDPIYAGFASFWDGLYSTLWLDGFLSGKPSMKFAPKWNYTFVLAAAWWGLVPTTLLFVGLYRSVARARFGGLSDRMFDRDALAVRFAVVVIGIYLAAIAYHALTVPFYSSVKAGYLLAATPAIALVAGAGVELLARRTWAKTAIGLGLAGWAVVVCLGYVVVG